MFPPLKLKHLGPYLAHSATNFEHGRIYNYYFAPGEQQTFPSTDASLWENRELTCKKKKSRRVPAQTFPGAILQFQKTIPPQKNIV